MHHNLRKAFLCILLPALFILAGSSVKPEISVPKKINKPTIDLYAAMHLQDSGLSREAFDDAIAGYDSLMKKGSIKNDSILSIIDFSHASADKRLFVLNTHTQKILFKTYVSHGRNSGLATANEFSNEPDSYKSSLGFYITSDTYKGKHGYSLRLVGQEPGINDNALARGIVMHSAGYVSKELAERQGYIGRSQGCPAIPEELHKAIIEKIKNGSCLFIYGNDKNYATASMFLPAHSKFQKINS